MNPNCFILRLIFCPLLLTWGCAKDSLDRDLINAAGGGDVVQIRKLLSQGANVNAKDTTLNQWTPLIWALWEGRDDAVLVLLQGGADPNLRDGTGHAPLSFALRRPGSAASIKALVLAGADSREFLPEVDTLVENDPNRLAFVEALKLKGKQAEGANK